MSIESAKAFMDQMKNDQDFAEQVKTFSNAEARRDFVEKNGFYFTSEEFDIVQAQLDDEELDMAVGGLSNGEGDEGKYCSKMYDGNWNLISTSCV